MKSPNYKNFNWKTQIWQEVEQMLRYIDVNLITTNWQSNALKTKKMHKASIRGLKILENVLWIVLELLNITE